MNVLYHSAWDKVARAALGQIVLAQHAGCIIAAMVAAQNLYVIFGTIILAQKYLCAISPVQTLAGCACTAHRLQSCCNHGSCAASLLSASFPQAHALLHNLSGFQLAMPLLHKPFLSVVRSHVLHA